VCFSPASGAKEKPLHKSIGALKTRYHPISAAKGSRPLASNNASTFNAVKRMRLSISVQRINSAESYTLNTLYQLAPNADSLLLK